MMTSVERLPHCRAKFRIELPPERVAGERQKVAREFQRLARLPGYRPGKAPLKMVEARFAKEIEDEATGNLVRESLREAIRKEALQVLEIAAIERAEVDSVGAMHIEAMALLEPEVPLPDYSSIEIELEKKEISEEDVDRFLRFLSEPHATFEPVEGRVAAHGDYAVATYSSRLEGRPLAEACPEAPAQLAGGTHVWIHLEGEPLVPGFASQILGMAPGATKSFSLVLPADYQFSALAGKELEFALELHSLHARVIPPLDDAFASRLIPGLNAEQVRQRARQQLEASAELDFLRARRNLAVAKLLEKADFELPAKEVERETRGVLHQIIRENQERGVSDEELRKHQDELIGVAHQSARDRVRARFLLLAIARREKLEATDAEVAQALVDLAHASQIPVKKLAAEMRKRGGFEDLREQILRRKALDLLASRTVLLAPSRPAAAEPPEAQRPPVS